MTDDAVSGPHDALTWLGSLRDLTPAFSALCTPVMVLDPNDRILHLNQAQARVLGRTIRSPSGVGLPSLAANAGEREHLARFSRAVRAGSGSVLAHVAMLQSPQGCLPLRLAGRALALEEEPGPVVVSSMRPACHDDVIRLVERRCSPSGCTPGSPGFRLFSAAAQMSHREIEVFASLSSGEATAEAAPRMGISGHTLRNHARAIYRKLGVRSRDEMYELVGAVSRRSYAAFRTTSDETTLAQR